MSSSLCPLLLGVYVEEPSSRSRESAHALPEGDRECGLPFHPTDVSAVEQDRLAAGWISYIDPFGKRISEICFEGRFL